MDLLKMSLYTHTVIISKSWQKSWLFPTVYVTYTETAQCLMTPQDKIQTGAFFIQQPAILRKTFFQKYEKNTYA